MKTKLLVVLMAYISLISICWEWNVNNDTNAIINVSPFSLDRIILLIGLIAIYAYAASICEEQKSRGGYKKREKICVGLLAVLFSIFMIVGKIIDSGGTISELYLNEIHIIKTVISMLGFGILFGALILSLFYHLNCVSIIKEKKGLENNVYVFVNRHPFGFSFSILLLAYIPYVVLSYPGICQGDFLAMVLQGFNLPEITSASVVLLDDNVYLNQHHPVIYTELIHLCLIIGKNIIDSYNVGLFIVSILQFIYATLIISYLFSYLISKNVDIRLCLITLLYFVLSPRIQQYMFLISKDVIYSYSILFLMIFVAKHIVFNRNGEISIKNTAFLALGCCLSVFFRNEGKYVVLLWMVVLLFAIKRFRKTIATVTSFLVLVVVIVNGVIMPYFMITPGSVREMLSIPFQQTARYVYYFDGEVTQKEREAIDKILDYETLSSRYIPDRSDSVKDGYNKYATKEDLIEYAKVWFQMFMKHPTVYLDATLNNIYYYFYPGKRLVDSYTYQWSATCMDAVNTEVGEINTNFHYPQILYRARITFELFREAIFECPILELFKSMAVYVWCLLILLFYFVFSNDKTGLLTIPLIIILGISLMGPCNGYYFRYTYVIAVCLPAVLFIGLTNKENLLLI